MIKMKAYVDKDLQREDDVDSNSETEKYAKEFVTNIVEIITKKFNEEFQAAILKDIRAGVIDHHETILKVRHEEFELAKNRLEYLKQSI